jgi:O-antigen/teichoic acid export membrane protein
MTATVSGPRRAVRRAALAAWVGRTVGDRATLALARNGGLAFFAGTVIYNAGNFFFHMAMSRMLGPARYGALGSLLGLVTVAVLPVSALQAAVTQSVAAHRARLRSPAPARPGSLGGVFAITALAGAAVLAVSAVASPLVDRFVDLGSPTPLLLCATYVAVSVATIVPQGVLIGRLQFGPVAASLVAGSVVRLASGIVLVGAGFGLDAASAASALAGVASLVVVTWPLRTELGLARRERAPRRSAPPDCDPVPSPPPAVGAPPTPAEPGEVALQAKPAVLAVVALAGVSAFLGLDSLLARHYLSRLDAGYYVAAATAARVSLFLPGAIAMTAFPRLVASRDVHHESRRLLASALGLTAVLSGGASATIALFPHLVITVLFGGAYQQAAGPLAILSAAAAAMGLASVLVYFFLAQTSVLAAGCWAAVGALALAVVVDHRGLDTIAWLTLTVTVSATLAMAAAAFGQRHPDRRRNRAPTLARPSAIGAGSSGPAGRAGEADQPAEIGLTLVVPAMRAARSAHQGDRPGPLVVGGRPVEVLVVEAPTGGQTADRRARERHGPPAGAQASASLRSEALRAAVSRARGMHVVLVGASWPDEVVDAVAAALQGDGAEVDLVLGPPRPSHVRSVVKRMGTLAAALALRVHPGDVGRPILAARRAVLVDILARSGPGAVGEDLEVLAVARRLGHRSVRRLSGPRAHAGASSPADPPADSSRLIERIRFLAALTYRLRVLHSYDADPDDAKPPGAVEEALL